MSRTSQWSGGTKGVTRYCGNAVIRCSYNDRQGQYECKIAVGGKHRDTQYVGAPASSRLAVDSREAFDRAAHAAVSFAEYDGCLNDADLESNADGSGWRIRRKK
jgi:hypothetical protein